MLKNKDDKPTFTFDGFEGFDAPNTTQVPDVFLDLVAPELSEAELRVSLYIIRRTFGFKKKSDDISLRQMVEGIITRDGRVLDRGTGLGKSGVAKALAGLLAKGVIVNHRNRSPERGNEPTSYALRFKSTPLSTGVDKGVSTGVDKGLSTGVDTQHTVKQHTVKQHDDDEITNALLQFGVSQNQAHRLAASYPATLIFEKLDLVTYLIDRRSPLVSRNPQGFLIKAIEENYLPAKTKGYKTKAEREAQAQQRQAQDAALEQARLDREQAIAAYKQDQQPKAISGTTLTTVTSWEQTLRTLQGQMTAANFNTWLKHTVLVDCQQGTALIAAPSTFVADWLQARMVPIVKRALVETLGQPVELHFTVAPELTPQADV
jgi:DnaA N-terminal domain/Bacteriophage replication protein O